MINISKIVIKLKLGKLISSKPLEKKSERNFFVTTTTGEYVFSIYIKGPRYRTLSELKAQKELSDYLIKNKLPVSKVVSTFRLNEQTNILIKTYLPGKSKYTPLKIEVTEFAKMFGRFHQLTQGFKTKNKIQHKWNLATTKKHLDELLKKFPHDKILNQIKTEIDALKIATDLPRGTIHEDLGKRHVLWNHHKIAGFIDFERAYYAPLVYDLGQVLRGWCFHSNWQKWCNKKLANILENYSTQRKITVEEKTYLFDSIKFAVLERAFSFYLKYLYSKDTDSKEYTLHSLNNLLSLLEKKKSKIQIIINAA